MAAKPRSLQRVVAVPAPGNTAHEWVWKPRNQEPFAPANPRLRCWQSLRLPVPHAPELSCRMGILAKRAGVHTRPGSALHSSVPLTVSVSAKRLIESCLPIVPLPEAASDHRLRSLSRSPSMNLMIQPTLQSYLTLIPRNSRAHHWCLAW